MEPMLKRVIDDKFGPIDQRGAGSARSHVRRGATGVVGEVLIAVMLAAGGVSAQETADTAAVDTSSVRMADTTEPEAQPGPWVRFGERNWGLHPLLLQPQGRVFFPDSVEVGEVNPFPDDAGMNYQLVGIDLAWYAAHNRLRLGISGGMGFTTFESKALGFLSASVFIELTPFVRFDAGRVKAVTSDPEKNKKTRDHGAKFIGLSFPVALSRELFKPKG